MSEKVLSGGNDGRRQSWTRALFDRLRGTSSSGTTAEMPPPYGFGDSGTANNVEASDSRPPLTSPARIMGVNEYGQVVGYVSPAYPTASWFNFQPAEKALILDVPFINTKRKKASGSASEPSAELVRLAMRNPTEAAAAGNFNFLGIQLHNAEGTNESWMLAACDEGRTGPIFKDRATMLRTTANAAMEGAHPTGNPASSKVWSLHVVEGDLEELKLNWFHKDGAILPLQTTSERVPKTEGRSPHMWGRRKSFVLTSDIPIRLIVERCSEPQEP